jgi:hypothetical protein
MITDKGDLIIKEHPLNQVADELALRLLSNRQLDGCSAFLHRWRTSQSYRAACGVRRIRQKFRYVDTLELPFYKRHTNELIHALAECVRYQRTQWRIFPSIIPTRSRIGRMLNSYTLQLPVHFLIWYRRGLALLPGLDGVVIGYNHDYSIAHVLYHYHNGKLAIRIARYDIKKGKWTWKRQ